MEVAGSCGCTSSLSSRKVAEISASMIWPGVISMGMPKIGVTGLSLSTEEDPSMEGGEGEHTLVRLGAIIGVGELETATDAKVVTTEGGLVVVVDPITRELGEVETSRAVLTIVDPTIFEVSGLIAMTFFPPDPVMKTNCFPVACREAAKAGGTMI